MPNGLEIAAGGLDDPGVRALLAEHLDDMYATSPAESVRALDLPALRAPAISFWTAREAGAVIGVAALKELSATEGELKSMRTARDARRRGVATALLAHLVETAVARGYRRLYLETGSPDAFAPARRLYAAHGFAECGPFGDYPPDPYSVFMVRRLS